MRVAVAGGTGLAGRHVVEELRAAGHEPVVLARSTGVDVTTGRGLDGALAGADAVIDVTNAPTISRRKAVAFFESASRHLLTAGERAGVRHHVALSIVGIERVGHGYYQGKIRQEQVVAAGPVPWTVLRATQFHEFADDILDRLRGPLMPVPPMRVQPVAVREVARALVELAQGPARGMAPELAGPREELLIDMVRRVLPARHERRLVLSVRFPGAAGRAMADGGLLPAGPGPRGTQTFDEWLTQRRTAAAGRG
ncbi:SDR family oxidoreductase [Streptomyces sp. NPDC015127]|uniref:SDR family oxidoreductase n=1 Tax=Streptomyces sp. NPDC015127 TaxID=3364939 RepID=UPI0037019C1C